MAACHVKRIVRAAAALVVGLLVVLVVNAFVFVSPEQFPWERVDPAQDPRWIPGRREERVLRLAQAIRIPTVSPEHGRQDPATFRRLHQHIRTCFPLVHSSPFVKVDVINEHSLLYEIRGTESGSPYLLTGHMDVVPANERTWSVDPFAGIIRDGVLYGRGAIDDKHSVMGILEAVEFLLESGFRPRRTFFLAFGHDEELSGTAGAGEIAKELQRRGLTFDFVLDEGLFILGGFMDGIDRPLAVIGVTEKGYATLELSVKMTAGHSSVPPPETPIGVLSRAVSRLERYRQATVFGLGPERDFFTYLAPYAAPLQRLVFANLWLLEPVLKMILAASPETDALQRTTTALTVFQAGYKSNVIAGEARALVNHRIHPGHSLEETLRHDRMIIDDERVTIHVDSFYPPMTVSPYGPFVEPFLLIARSVKQVFTDSVVAPMCSPAYTDLQQYRNLSSHLYRLTPNFITPDTQRGLHGDDERITIDQYHDLIHVYVRIILNADRMSPHAPHDHDL